MLNQFCVLLYSPTSFLPPVPTPAWRPSGWEGLWEGRKIPPAGLRPTALPTPTPLACGAGCASAGVGEWGLTPGEALCMFSVPDHKNGKNRFTQKLGFFYFIYLFYTKQDYFTINKVTCIAQTFSKFSNLSEMDSKGDTGKSTKL